MISAISPSTPLPPSVDQPIGDAPERRVRREARGVVGAAALHRENQLRRRRTTHAAAIRACRQEHRRQRCPCSVARTVPPSALNREHFDRLAVAFRCIGKCLRHHLLAAERDHHTAPTLGCPQYAASVVRRAHVGTELAAPGEVRQRRAERQRRRGDAFGDQRRADHRRNDEDVVAGAGRPSARRNQGSRGERPARRRGSCAGPPEPRPSGGSASRVQPR